MRSREKIEEDYHETSDCGYVMNDRRELVLEVLLDIRELLQALQGKKEKKP